MKRAVVLKHIEFEGPARIAPLLQERGYALEVRDLHLGHAVPEQLERGDVLVVMGGPMGVGDLDDPRFAFLRKERELLTRCIDTDSPVLGVCLGAQLLASAAGAAVYPMKDSAGQRVYEVGWAPLRWAHAEHPGHTLLCGLPAQSPVLHWHGDTYDLPRSALRLASTDACPNQCFQLGTRQLGLQFHAELSASDVEQMLHADLEFAIKAGGPAAAERIREGTLQHLQRYRQDGDRLLANVLDMWRA